MYLWRIEKQPYLKALGNGHCCDLLSNCIFDVLKNNEEVFRRAAEWVVICFQIVSLTYWKTTKTIAAVETMQLWFAFKLYLWRIEKQLGFGNIHVERCCDLLSNCIFDVLKNNFGLFLNPAQMVVICFQIVSLTYWKTTNKEGRRVVVRLWFAFKLYLWRIEKQHQRNRSRHHSCCDLLSNCIFDVLKNNNAIIPNAKLFVVICFQIVSLTYWKTTRVNGEVLLHWLWFAFKLYLWRIEKQLKTFKLLKTPRCDLLSNCIFDVLKNNLTIAIIDVKAVVICFQIVSLTYWKTTAASIISSLFWLWFAFKLYLWRIEKQQTGRTTLTR